MQKKHHCDAKNNAYFFDIAAGSTCISQDRHEPPRVLKSTRDEIFIRDEGPPANLVQLTVLATCLSLTPLPERESGKSLGTTPGGWYLLDHLRTRAGRKECKGIPSGMNVINNPPPQVRGGLFFTTYVLGEKKRATMKGLRMCSEKLVCLQQRDKN